VSSYGGTTCVDSGAIQSHYSLIFSVEPPTNIPVAAAFAAAVQLLESGSPFPLGGLTIPLSLRASNGLLNLNSLTTDATGLAASSLLQVSAAGTGDTLVANLPLTASGGLPSVGLAASSSSFNVGSPTGCDDDRDHSRRHDHDDHDRGRCRCNSEEDRRHSRDMRKKCEPGD
jgi:hypothetical protein